MDYEILSSKGTPKIPVILLDFADYPRSKSTSLSSTASSIFGYGDTDNFPYNSVTRYYYRSSYKQLLIKGNVLGWYRAKYKRAHYSDNYESLIKEALVYFDKRGVDFRPYDYDKNGTIEGMYFLWTGPSGGVDSNWWPMCESWQGSTLRVDGKKIDQYVWSWFSEYDPGTSPDFKLDVATLAHETGHLLGLPDLYDYEPNQGPKGGVGGLDLMDNYGDINCFFKYLLGWIKPTIISSGMRVINLRPSGLYPDAVLIKKGYNGNKFSEYFMVQYRKKVGNDVEYPTNGLIIWHVDGTLTRFTKEFQYDNSYTKHKLLKLMEADGLEEIEKYDDYEVEAKDYYRPSKSFSYSTKPNSRNYQGFNTHVVVTNITKPGTTMGARMGLI
jgi:M6 family metalloprotease-like protein